MPFFKTGDFSGYSVRQMNEFLFVVKVAILTLSRSNLVHLKRINWLALLHKILALLVMVVSLCSVLKVISG